MPDALIWGASGGMGAALVTLLKAGGWRVFGAARQLTRIPDVADLKLPFDATAIQTFQDVNLAIATETEGLELMVYAAGSLRADTWAKLSLADWDTVMASNLTGAYLATSHSLNLMQPTGHMVYIGAYVDHLVLPKMGAYAAAKAGLELLVDTLRKEQRSRRFTLVRPGAVHTPFWDHAPFKLPNDAKTPQDVAQAIVNHHTSGRSGELNL